jgi:hypothetical protein
MSNESDQETETGIGATDPADELLTQGDQA